MGSRTKLRPLPPPGSAAVAKRQRHLSTREVDYSVAAEWAALGYTHVYGLDAVGNGALFGPLVAACVCFPIDLKLQGVYDSKALSPQQRSVQVPIIKQHAAAWALGSITVEEFDLWGPSTGELVAMARAFLSVDSQFATNTGLMVLDGRVTLPSWSVPPNYKLPEMLALPKGDAKVLAVAAASILAKEDRDALIVGMAAQFPQYGLEQHVGYGVAAHIAAIKQYGLTPYHRRTARHFAEGYDGDTQGEPGNAVGPPPSSGRHVVRPLPPLRVPEGSGSRRPR